MATLPGITSWKNGFSTGNYQLIDEESSGKRVNPPRIANS
jgi:hypothetical protein